MTDSEIKHPRRIKSFVLRCGRLTTGQQRGLDENWDNWGLTLEQGALNPEAVFGRDAPLVLEIGYGMGLSLVEMAAAAPEKDFIGIEVHRPGVGSLLNEANQQGLTNLRTYCEDAIQVLEQCVADNSLDRVQLFFPDPWHKKRHHKRRIVQPAFAELLRKKLKVGGQFHMATDWENYAEHMLEVMSAAPGYRNLAGEQQYMPRPDYRPLTKFEKRGQRLGHGVWDLVFERVE